MKYLYIDPKEAAARYRMELIGQRISTEAQLKSVATNEEEQAARAQAELDLLDELKDTAPKANDRRAELKATLARLEEQHANTLTQVTDAIREADKVRAAGLLDTPKEPAAPPVV